MSPSHYDHERNVPTWNYLAVHCWGRVEIVDGAAEKDALLKRLIGQMEPGYAAQWRACPRTISTSCWAPSSACVCT